MSYESWSERRYDAYNPDENVRKISSKFFKDKARDWTIGYGHKLTKFDYKKYWDKVLDKKGEGIPLFNNDLNHAINTSLKKFLKDNRIKLTQYQYDALVSMTFNCDEGFWGWHSSKFKSMRDFVKKKNYTKKGANHTFGLYVFSGGQKLNGLVKRRKREAKIFNGGSYINKDGKKIN